MKKKPVDFSPSEALFAFGAWLTIRDEKVTFSKKHNAAPMVELIGEFMDRHNLEEVRDGWEKKIVPEPNRPKIS